MYTAIFYFLIRRQKMKYFPNEYLELSSGYGEHSVKLPLFSLAPFCDASVIVHIRGLVGYRRSGRRDTEFVLAHSSHYTILLAPDSKLTEKTIIDSHHKVN